jgi:hypothetical protein
MIIKARPLIPAGNAIVLCLRAPILLRTSRLISPSGGVLAGT